MDNIPRRVDELPLLMTVEEVAAVLRIGRNGAYAAVASGAIPSVRIGRAIRIPRGPLMRYLDVTDALESPSPA